MNTDIELERAIRSSLADIIATSPEASERPVRAVATTESPRSRGLLAVAAASIVVAGVVAVAVVSRTGDEASSTPPPADLDVHPVAPVPVPPDAAAPGELVPFVADPPPGFGPFVGAQRDGALRTGSWVATAIGRPDPDGYLSPIVVSVFDGRWTALDGADTVPIAGQQFQSRRFDGFEVLATVGSPTIAVSGGVGRDLLHDVLLAVTVEERDEGFAAAIDPMPDGFVEISPSRVLAADPTPRRTLAQHGGELGINEVSDWVDPSLYAASTAADIESHALGDHVAWSGVTTANPNGPIRFLVWSPSPGTVFEIVSTGPTYTADDLVELAATTSAVTADEFDVALSNGPVGLTD